MFCYFHYRWKVKPTKRFECLAVKLLSRAAFQTGAISDFIVGKRSAYFFMPAAEDFSDKSDLFAKHAMINLFFS